MADSDNTIIKHRCNQEHINNHKLTWKTTIKQKLCIRYRTRNASGLWTGRSTHHQVSYIGLASSWETTTPPSLTRSSVCTRLWSQRPTQWLNCCRFICLLLWENYRIIAEFTRLPTVFVKKYLLKVSGDRQILYQTLQGSRQLLYTGRLAPGSRLDHIIVFCIAVIGTLLVMVADDGVNVFVGRQGPPRQHATITPPLCPVTTPPPEANKELPCISAPPVTFP